MNAIIDSSGWLVDLGKMTCKNMISGIEVVFEKNGEQLEGKIHNIPLSMVDGKQCNHPYLLMQIMAAEAFFLKAYINKQLDAPMLKKTG
jgi:hypothetical protein